MEPEAELEVELEVEDAPPRDVVLDWCGVPDPVVEHAARIADAMIIKRAPRAAPTEREPIPTEREPIPKERERT